MPVLTGDSAPTPFRGTERDIDNLVDEVRERLCLKSREKLKSVRRSTPYAPNQNSNGAVRRKGSTFVLASETGDAVQSSANGARVLDYKHLCKNCRRLKKSVRCNCLSSTDLRDDNLLKHLLAEQRLIQEAVRRIHGLHHHQCSDESSKNLDQSSSPSSVRSSSTDSMDSSAFSSTVELR